MPSIIASSDKLWDHSDTFIPQLVTTPIQPEIISRQEKIAAYRNLTQPDFSTHCELEYNQLVRNGLLVNYLATGIEPNRIQVQLKIPIDKMNSAIHAPLLLRLGAYILQVSEHRAV